MGDKTQLLIDYLRALSDLKRADYFANNEIKRVLAKIEKDLDIK